MSSLKSKISLSQHYSCTVFSWLIACLKLSIGIIICHYYVHQLFTSGAYLNHPQDTLGPDFKKESSSSMAWYGKWIVIFISVWFRFLKTTSNGIRNFVDCKILISIADRSFKSKKKRRFFLTQYAELF